LKALAQSIEPEDRGGSAAEHHGGNEREGKHEAEAYAATEPARRCVILIGYHQRLPGAPTN